MLCNIDLRMLECIPIARVSSILVLSILISIFYPIDPFSPSFILYAMHARKTVVKEESAN